ncbi:MAG: spore protease YyaC [Sporomusaceae bacterium]|nr:spore protease YyaC [Sporomusaceae bacterium]
MEKFSQFCCVNDLEKKACTYLWNIERTQDLVLRSLVCLCIGSDRYTGDALGPLVGTFLQENSCYPIYGSLDQPVHGGNLASVVEEIHKRYNNPFILAVDACLGKHSEIGKIEIWSGSITAGLAVGNQLPPTGEISLVGIVNAASESSHLVLQSTSLALVMKQAKKIAAIIRLFQDQLVAKQFLV